MRDRGVIKSRDHDPRGTGLMKRKVIIAVTTAAVLVGGGAATAAGVTSGSGGDQDAKALPTSSDVRLADDDAHSDADDPDGPDGTHDSEAHDDDDDGTARDNAADRDEDTGNADLSVSQASEAILKATPGTLTELELDTDNNKLVWEADVLGKDRTWHKVGIDAASGKVVQNRVDHDDDSGVPRTPKIDAVAAAKKAASTTNGSVTSIDLESNGSRWEVDTVGKNGTEHEVDIDATSGKVLKHQSEPADNDGDDDGDDGDDIYDD
ncbi:PepSY domain-containing protein [Streptomyces iconiensis]|uniref:PepSY domain-containing protein n=1 Tax=Streptomyces iconiensis TaxID=1384038 RepID=A0ABT7A1I4_9ACTN|nr:PepSY domain-containing protein [Streptomyces iconiensis]MDJ1135171.1 PepSY domain-containing protein [Streptomyces iconiensis]